MLSLTIEQVNAYIESKQNAWSNATKKSEQSRLISNLSAINNGPLALINQTNLSKYTLKTLFIRAGELCEFIGLQPNPYKTYLKSNALFFKNAYERVEVGLTWEEAKERLSMLTDERVRAVALGILASGLRSKEALSYDGSGKIVGKGAKLRDVYIDDNLAQHDLSYIALYRALKKVGLKPHDLRKLAATKLVSAGFKEADLLAVMGWSNIQTASYYLQTTKKDELKARLISALK